MKATADRSKRMHAPGPPGVLGIRNVLRFTTGQLELLRELADRYGDVVEMKVLGTPWFLLSHPDDIEAAVVKNARVMLRDAYTEVLQRALGLGLLTSDGELWKRQRKLMSQAFTPKRIHGYGAAMVSVTDRSIGSLRHASTVNLHQEMSRVTMEVVAEVLFGASVSAQEVKTVREAMEVVNEFFANSPEAVLKLESWVPTPRNRRMSAAVKEIDALVYRIIANRRAALSRAKNGDASGRDDLLGTLLASLDDEGTGMTDRQLRDEAITLFLAGHETTALALAHTFYLLSKHPIVERRLFGELDAVLGGRLPSSDDVRRLPYTERVLKESMRLYPPAWTIGREVAETVELGGYTIPKGAQILCSQWVVHRDPRWFPNPEGFDPDRWEPERASLIPRFAYFPFGGGPRVCIGNHFAMLEATLLLATIAQRLRFELLPGQRLDLEPSVTLRQRGPGLDVNVIERTRAEPSIRATAGEHAAI